MVALLAEVGEWVDRKSQHGTKKVLCSTQRSQVERSLRKHVKCLEDVEDRIEANEPVFPIWLKQVMR